MIVNPTRVYRFGLFIVLLLSLGACESKPRDPNRHYEDGGGFSLVAPDGWNVTEFPGFKYRVFLGTPVDEFAPNLNVVDEVFQGTIDRYVEQSLTTMEKLFPEFEKLSQEDFTLDSGARAVRIVTQNVQFGKKLTQTFYMVGDGSTKYVLTASKLATDTRDLDPLFDASARSFRFDD